MFAAKAQQSLRIWHIDGRFRVGAEVSELGRCAPSSGSCVPVLEFRRDYNAVDLSQRLGSIARTGTQFFANQPGDALLSVRRMREAVIADLARRFHAGFQGRFQAALTPA